MSSLKKGQSIRIELGDAIATPQCLKELLIAYLKKIECPVESVIVEEDEDLLEVDIEKDVKICEIVKKWHHDIYWGGGDSGDGGYERGVSEEEDGFELIQKVLNELKGRKR